MKPWRSEIGRTVLELVALGVLLGQYGLGVVGGWGAAWTSVFGVDLAVLMTFLAGRRIFFESLVQLLRLKIGSDLAVALAALAALWIGRENPAYYLAAFEVVFIMRVGGFLEELAVEKTRSAVGNLGRLLPPTARIVRDGKTLEIPLEELRPGDTLLIRPGERIAADARVTRGGGAVDQSALTGESMPEDKSIGDPLFAGTINLMGALEAEATATGGGTTLGKIIHLVEATEEEKAPVEKTADRYARWFVPIVIALAGLTWWITGDLVRSVSVMVIACPCAMVLATPTAIAAGIGRLALSGVLVKGGPALEALGRVGALAIDKTGTITQGRPRVLETTGFEGNDDVAVLKAAAFAESPSGHPLGVIVAEEAARRGIAADAPDRFESFPGRGVIAESADGGRRVVAGNAALMRERGIDVTDACRSTLERMEAGGVTVVLVAESDRLLGAIALGDEMRSDAPGALARLREAGIGKLVLLTGDSSGPAQAIASQAGIEEWEAGMLPADKVGRVRRLRTETRRPVAFLGDGINDAPAMIAADVGIAMGEIGSDIAIDAADVVLVPDDLEKLPLAFAVGRRVIRTIRVNLAAFALGFNGAAVAAASMGWVSPVWASVVHQISSLLVVCNSLRIFFWGRWAESGPGRAHAAIATSLENAVDWSSKLFSRREFPARRRILTGAVTLAALAYAGSGFIAIEPGEIGIHLRLGKRATPDWAPGPHYDWPRPFSRTIRVRPDEERRVEVGYRSAGMDILATPAAGAVVEWEAAHQAGGYQWQPEEALIVTGDESLIAASMTLHYRLTDPAAYVLWASDPEETIRGAAEGALRSVAAGSTLDSTLVSKRAELEARILEKTRKFIEPCALGVALTRVALQDVHPPPATLEAYREVASALEDRSRIVYQAEGERNYTVPLARGEAAAALSQARAYSVEAVKNAGGGSGRFALAAKALGGAGNRGAVLTRLYYQALEQALTGRTLFVRDASLGAAYRLVLGDGSTSAPPAALIENSAGAGVEAEDHSEEGRLERP